MYDDQSITGVSLPQQTLCLTFDDGPGQTDGPGFGPRTVELARFLKDQGVAASFFMVGKFASDLPEILPQVEALGHLVCNHTYDHANLPEYLDLGGSAALQVAKTDGLVRNWIDAPVVYLRAPYGSWNANVAAELNANLSTTLSHIGPIGWDIDGGDWASWQNGESPQTAFTNYLNVIEATSGKRGITLMHDCTADMEVVKRANRTLEMLQLLIPELKKRGYKFVRLDQVPDVKVRTQKALRIALKGSNGLYVSPQAGGGGGVLVNGPAVGAWEPLVVQDLYVGKVALQVTNGRYISPQGGGGGAVLANGPAIGDWEPFDLISLGNYRVAFRSITGDFLTCNPQGVLDASSHLDMSESTIFTYEFVS